MADESEESGWYATRMVFEWEPGLYEERITLWQADSFDEAIDRGVDEARRYANDHGMTGTGMVQAFALFEAPGDGAEVFSLLRESDLSADDYVEAFFDTGRERQGGEDDDEPDDDWDD